MVVKKSDEKLRPNTLNRVAKKPGILNKVTKKT